LSSGYGQHVAHRRLVIKHGDIDLAGQQPFEHMAAETLDHAHRNLRILLAIPLDQRHCQHRANRGRHADGDATMRAQLQRRDL